VTFVTTEKWARVRCNLFSVAPLGFEPLLGGPVPLEPLLQPAFYWLILGSLWNFLPRLALNHDPPNLSLPCSWDYRHELLHLALLLKGFEIKTSHPLCHPPQQPCPYHPQVVDLRWGVRSSEATEHMTKELCLEELSRCQRTSIGPAFVVSVWGEMGWPLLPLPSQAAWNPTGPWESCVPARCQRVAVWAIIYE
jgi:hypothetical protein